MKKLIALVLACVAVAAQAAPQSDDLDRFISGQKIVSQIQHVGRNVRDTATGIRLYANGRTAAHWTRGRESVGLATPLWAPHP